MGNCHSICEERYSNREWFDTWESQDSENLQYMEADSLHSNEQLLSELHSFVGPKGVSLGIVLISPSQTCKLCGSSLMVKADRPSRVTVYTDTIGTTEGTHYRKICKKYKSWCPFVQHYGHYSTGGTNIYFSEDWESLPYFISTRETAVQMSLLQQLDAEILIGQLSYKELRFTITSMAMIKRPTR